MTPGSNSVWIDVTDHALDATLFARGRAARSHRVALGPGFDQHEFTQALASSLGQLGVSRPRVEVCWRAQDAAVTVVQTPVVGRAAPSAAVLSMIESGGVDSARQDAEAVTVGVHAAHGSYVLVSVIDRGRIESVRRAIMDAGARPGRVFAGEAFAAPAAIASALGAGAEDPALTIAMGEHVSAIAVTNHGKLELVRFADIGASALREPYARALAHAGAGVSEAMAEADALLFGGVGVPSPGEEIAPGVPAAAVFRAMQPALQRIFVELKQSLRFTLDPSEQLRVQFRVVGPAARIGGLEAILAEQIEVEHAPAEAASGEASAWVEVAVRAGATGWKGVAASNEGAPPSSAPLAPLLAGAAAAILAIGAVGFTADRAATSAGESSRAVAARLDAISDASASAMDLRMASAAEAVEGAVASWFASSADLGAAARLITEAAGEDVRIESFGAQRGADATTARLTARASGVNAEASRAALQRFVAALDASPLTSTVEVGSVRLVDESSPTYVSFSATVGLRETVPDWFLERSTP